LLQLFEWYLMLLLPLLLLLLCRRPAATAEA
jgi:hypothetical protein